MTTADWHPTWCSPARCTAHLDDRQGEHSSTPVRVAANTRWVDVAMYLSTRRHAVAWVVLTADASKLMFTPAEAQRLGIVMIDLAYSETKRKTEDSNQAVPTDSDPSARHEA